MTDQTTPPTLVELLEFGESAAAAIQVPNGHTITYGSLRRQVHMLSQRLTDLGIRRTDRVAILLPNGPETVISFLAVTAVAIAAPLNPAYKPRELKFYLEDAKARAIITSENITREPTDTSLIHIVAASDSNGEVSFTPPKKRQSLSPGPPSPGDVALVLHTSGTTSRPKRVPLTHANLAASVRNIVETYQLTDQDASLCVMPLFHVHGLVASALSTLASGGTLVIPPRFDALSFWPVVRAHDVTWFTAVPSMHQALLKRARRKNGHIDLGKHRLRFVRSCSAPLPSDTMIELEDLFRVPVLEAYGMTEATHQMTSNPLPPGLRVPGSVGPGTGVAVAIMDEAGKVQDSGVRGEVVIQGTNVTAGYEDNAEANAASFTDGWFRTGDEGILDSKGYLTLVGRLKELINRSGEKISPWEIDEVLKKHPSVSEAVAFGVAHPTHGEEPAAAVVLTAPATQRELVAHCRAHLADFKCPRVIHIVDKIPTTATGKVQRRAVAAALASGSSESVS